MFNGLLLLKRVDQVDGGEEPDLLAVVFGRLDAERGGDVGLAGAWAADQHDIIGVVDELAAVQLPDHRLIDLAGREVEAGQILVCWEASRLDLVGDRPDLALGDLGLEQLGEDRNRRGKGGSALLDKIAGRLGHAIHLERAQHDHDGGAGRVMTHDADP